MWGAPPPSGYTAGSLEIVDALIGCCPGYGGASPVSEQLAAPRRTRPRTTRAAGARSWPPPPHHPTGPERLLVAGSERLATAAGHSN